ncbi:MAG: acyl carrier protein [Eubacterium sp.]|nr:acyl carrier protein [Eubacterium sp.]
MIFETIKKIIIDIFDEEEERITLETHLAGDLGLDHMDMVDLIVEVETAFDVVIPDEDVEQFETVADIVNYLEMH